MSIFFLKNEKSSASIENFWISINKKLNNEKMERIEVGEPPMLIDISIKLLTFWFIIMGRLIII